MANAKDVIAITTPMRIHLTKRRLIYLACFILIIPIGLATRKYGYAMPHIIATYGGDVLYATCWFFFLRMFIAKPPVWKVALFACFICYVIEVLELIQAPWMKNLQHTPPLGLILGYGFNWSDLVCYTIGCLLGWGIGVLIEKTCP